MKTVNTQDADLSVLVEEAAAGEEIIIAKAGKPMARLTSLETNRGEKEKDFRSTFGALKDKIWIDEDTFDDPLPPDFLKPIDIEE